MRKRELYRALVEAEKRNLELEDELLDADERALRMARALRNQSASLIDDSVVVLEAIRFVGAVDGVALGGDDCCEEDDDVED